MLRKILPLVDVKARKDGTGGFEGYGSVFNNIDSYGDIVVRGAFAGTIEQFLKTGFASVGHHWSDLPVATFSSAVEDDKGLYVVADFHSDDFSQRTRLVTNERIDRGKSVGLSIGFDIKDGGAVFGTDENGFPAGIRILKDLELFEVALVNVPANPATWVTGAKSAQMCEDAQCGCRVGSTHHQGLKFADHGEALLAELRGYALRAQALVSKRADQQRTLSSEQQDRVTALVTELRTCVGTLEGVTAEPEVVVDVEARTKLARTEIARYEVLRAKTLIGV